MAIDERRRHDLYVRAEEVLGPEPANTLMELLPPVGWGDVATKRDLDNLANVLRVEMHILARTLFLAIVTIVLTMSGLVFALAR